MKTLEYEDYELQDRNGYPLGYGSGIEQDSDQVSSYLKLTLVDDTVVTIDEANITSETIAEYKSRIKAVELGENIESVANETFKNISTLESVKLNYAAETGDYAFGENNALTEVVLGKKVTSIAEKQFANCQNLININIPNSVTTIGVEAFSKCYDLTSITIPKSVTAIGEFAFGGCSGLESISVASGNTKYDSRDNCNAIIETATNTLIFGCNNTIIPNSVTTIGNSAFNGYTGLTNVNFPNSIISIGNDAFKLCFNLTSVTIPNSVTSIGNEAFFNCSNLTSVTIGNSVTSIGSSAFSGTAWYNNQPDGVVYAGLVAYTYKGTMPSGTSITLKDDTKGIADYAFSGCRGLTSVTIGDSVISIGNWAFNACSGLTSVTIPNSVTSISDYAFYGCSGLTSVTIGNSIETIGNGAFISGSQLTNITINATTPPELDGSPFNNLLDNLTIYVPTESVAAYKAASSWSSYVNRIQAIQ